MVDKYGYLYYLDTEVDKRGEIPSVKFQLKEMSYLLFNEDNIRETKEKINNIESNIEFKEWYGTSVNTITKIKEIIYTKVDRIDKRRSTISKVLNTTNK